MTLTLKEQIGQCFHPAAYIHDSPEGIQEIESLIKDHCIGGLTFFYSRESVETNFDKKTFEQKTESVNKLRELIARYQSLAKVPLLISIDAEWGLGMRINSWPAFPYPLTLAAITDMNLIYETARAIASELKSVGVHLNLAPVLDINTNPLNPVIGHRSFGTTPERVTAYTRVFNKGLQSIGILSCAKHFPGHGDTKVDSHLSLPVLEKSIEQLRNNELIPFKELINDGVDCVMPGHLAVPKVTGCNNPASLSHTISTTLLREELEFKGVVITDALNMKSVSSLYPEGRLELEAFKAGADILSFSSHIKEGINLILDNCSKARIEQCCQRIQGLKEKAGLFKNAQNNHTMINKDKHRSLRIKLAERAITVVKDRQILKGNGRKTKNMVLIQIGKIPESSIIGELTGISTLKLSSPYSLDMSSIATFDHAVVALYPPSYKPLNDFGMEESLLNLLEMLGKGIECSLYLFGNPYILNLLDLTNFQEVVVCYQSFPEFEAKSAEHINGILEAKGSLPIDLQQ